MYVRSSLYWLRVCLFVSCVSHVVNLSPFVHNNKNMKIFLLALSLFGAM